MTPIDSAFIQTLFHPRQLDLAAQIVASGAVEILRESGLSVSASILGTSSEPYSVQITLAKEGFSGSCDCPSAAQGPCKHQAALAFACCSSGLAVSACSRPAASNPSPTPAVSRLLAGLLQMDHQRLASFAESLCSDSPSAMAAAKIAVACEAWPDPRAESELRSAALRAGDPCEFETSLAWSRKARAAMAPVLDKALSDPAFSAFGAELFLACSKAASASTDAPPDDSSGALCETAALFSSHGARLLSASGASPAAAAQAFADIVSAGDCGWACVSVPALSEHFGASSSDALATEILARFNSGGLDRYAASSVVEACASSTRNLDLLEQALSLSGEPPQRRAAKIHSLLVASGRFDEAFGRALEFVSEGAFDAGIFGFVSERLRALGTPEKSFSVDEVLFKAAPGVESYRRWMESASAACKLVEAEASAYLHLSEPDRLRREAAAHPKKKIKAPSEGESRAKVNALCRILVAEARVEEALVFAERDSAGPDGARFVALSAAKFFPDRALAVYERGLRTLLESGTTPPVYRKFSDALAAGCDAFAYDPMKSAVDRIRDEYARRPNVLKALKALEPRLAESLARSLSEACLEPTARRRPHL